MKFRVSKKVSCFGVGSSVYYPGDIVEGPEEWVKTNSHILEPIPEPKQAETHPPLAITAPAEAASKTEEIINPVEEKEEKDGSEERYATADRRPKKR
jgi:hypothetical protein